MGKRREVRVKAVGKPTRGMFKGELMPNEWLSSVDEIAEKWARRFFPHFALDIHTGRYVIICEQLEKEGRWREKLKKRLKRRTR